MDDTVAMQDINIRPGDSAGSGAVDEQIAALKGTLTAPAQPSTPQQASDAASVASDSSSQEQASRQPLPARPLHGSVDVDAAKQAAMSALAGLDLTTTKANLDASKAAAATARANGEIPIHTRKSSLRSVSCRQLGTSSTSSSTPTASKTVAFDDAAKNKAGLDASRPGPGQWRGGVTDGLARRTTRGPASRCISLPHVLQGRAGMNNRLATTYAQDAALQQQLQLLGGAGVGQQFTMVGQSQQGGVHHMDTLSMFQLQHQLQHQATNVPAALLAQQRGYAAPGLVSLDDSAVPVQGGNIILQARPQQLQQLQPQQARLTGTWNTAAAGQPQLSWGTGQVAQQGIAQPANTNVQLLAKLQATSQGQQAGETLWVTPASASLQMPANRPQGIVLQQAGVSSGMASIAGLQQQQLLAAQLQPAGIAGSRPAAGAAAGAQPAGGTVNGNTLLENYQSVSWSVLAAAQGESNLRDQLLTELVLLLTLLHTLNIVLKGSMSAADALGDFNYLATAARRHMATFNRLSQAGNIAVQLLAMITPLALWHLSSSELLEAAFLVLDTLALANRDVAIVVSQQRMTAMASLGMQLPMEQLLQQQTLALHWIAGLASAVSRNKAVLESMAGEVGSQGGAAAAAPAGMMQANTGISGAGLLPVGALGMSSSQPMMVASAANPTAGISGNALSPNRKTPLATYFEEASLGQPAAAATGATTGLGAVAPGATSGLVLGGAGQGLPDQLMTANGLAGVQLGAPAGQDDTAAAATGELGFAGLDKLAGFSLGVSPASQVGAPAGAGAQGTAAGTAAGAGTYSPLGGGLSLFGDGTLLIPGSSAPSSAGAPSMMGL